jgi:integrase
VLPSPVTKKPIAIGSLSNALLRARARSETYRPHDLRRTCATGLASLGVPRFTIARVLGHAEREITAVYDRYGYDTEKKDALQRWADHLLALIVSK